MPSSVAYFVFRIPYSISTAKTLFYRKDAKNAKKKVLQSILNVKRLCVNLCVFAPSRLKSPFFQQSRIPQMNATRNTQYEIRNTQYVTRNT